MFVRFLKTEYGLEFYVDPLHKFRCHLIVLSKKELYAKQLFFYFVMDVNDERWKFPKITKKSTKFL